MVLTNKGTIITELSRVKGGIALSNARTVRDSFGELQIPEDAYYGAQTARAIENFPISGLRLPSSFIRAQAMIKWAAAFAHSKLNVMADEKAQAIMKAADEVIEGQFNRWFLVDVYQAGAGTSQNMNANEVIASRAAEILGGTRGETHLVHPNDDVNKSQSTNDTIHIAMQLAAAEQITRRLTPALIDLAKALDRKASQFSDVVKSGRTHLQDAVPMRLGDEFSAWAHNVRRHQIWLEQATEALFPIGFGGNAVGTGINTPQGFAATAVAALAEKSGLPLILADNPFTFNQNPDEIVYVSGVLRSLSLALQRIANDLRLLSSGPRTGLGEIELPAVQPGSSIMPGKVNPVMAEMLNMVAFQVQGCDTTIANACGAGQLELNVMMPVIAANFLHEIEILKTSIRSFTTRCICGITADADKCRYYAERSLSLATALNTEIGYDKASKVVKYALENDLTLQEAATALNVSESALKRALDVDAHSSVVKRTSLQ